MYVSNKVIETNTEENTKLRGMFKRISPEICCISNVSRATAITCVADATFFSDTGARYRNGKNRDVRAG